MSSISVGLLIAGIFSIGIDIFMLLLISKNLAGSVLIEIKYALLLRKGALVINILRFVADLI